MTDTLTDPEYGPAPVSACPACIATPSALDRARVAEGPARIMLSVPDAHCALCITNVEGDLEKMPW